MRKWLAFIVFLSELEGNSLYYPLILQSNSFKPQLFDANNPTKSQQ